MPPGKTWPALFGVSVRLRTVLTITASCLRSPAPVAGDRARKNRLTPGAGAAAEVAGTVTTAQTVATAPALTTPLLVITAAVAEQSPATPLASARKLTLQPAGSVSAAKLLSVLAASA